MTIEQTMYEATRQHQAGWLAEAEQLYQQILRQQPSHPEALQLLGVLKHQQGQSGRAVELIGRAIALRPNSFRAHSNWGEALRILGRLDEAIADHRRAVALGPGQA
ncbi:MAG TPA: tetratricopeptide repeat protein [Pirellulales bacterium]|nr:tetratricopeptide repeat protein [Pirellulales bacterium]